MNKTLKIIGKTLAAIGVLISFIWVLLQTPHVQTRLARKAAAVLEERLGGRITFSKILFKPFNAFVIKDLLLTDTNPAIIGEDERIDTVMSAKSIVSTFYFHGPLLSKKLQIRRLAISEADLNLASDERGLNLPRMTSPDSTKERKGWGKDDLFHVNRLEINNFRIRFKKQSDSVLTGGINYNDIDVMVEKLLAMNLGLENGRFKVDLQKFSAVEKSGFMINDLSAKAAIGPDKAEISELHLSDGNSTLFMPTFMLDNTDKEGSEALSSLNTDKEGSEALSFLQTAQMKVSLKDSRIDSRTLDFLAPGLMHGRLVLNIPEADMGGSLDNLSIGKMTAQEESSGTSAFISGSISGISNLGTASMDLAIHHLRFSTEGVETLISATTGKTLPDLKKYAPGEYLAFSGSGSGPLRRLSAKGRLEYGEGKAETSLEIGGLLSEDKGLTLAGTLSTDQLDLGRLAGIPEIGEATAMGGFNARLEKGDSRIVIDSLKVDSFNALGYNYSDIRANGTFSGHTFDGRLVCSDPNLNFLFQGLFTFSDKTENSLYKFYANLGYADLHALKLDKREVSRASGQVNANYMVAGQKEMIGSIDIRNILLENADTTYMIGDIGVSSHSNNRLHRINLDSKFLTGSFVGTKSASSMISDLLELTTERNIPAIHKKITDSWEDGNEYNLSLTVRDAQDLLDYFKPGMYIAENSSLRLKIDEEGLAKVVIYSPRLAMGRNFIRETTLSADNADGSLKGVMDMAEAAYSSLKLMGGKLALTGAGNKVSATFAYNNGGANANNGRFSLSADMERDSKGQLLVHGLTLPSSFSYNGNVWTIPSSRFDVTGPDLKLSGLLLRCGEQSFKLSGGYASTYDEVLRIDLNKFDLSILNSLVPRNLGVDGKVTGKIILSSPWKTNAGLDMSIVADSTKFGHQTLGTLRAASSLDEGGRMKIFAVNDIDGISTMNINADYLTKSDEIEARAKLYGFNAAYLTPVLSNIFGEIGGKINGDVTISGGGGKGLRIESSRCNFEDVLLQVGYTQVPYWVSGPFSISEKGLSFDDVALRDSGRGTGRVAGGISWDSFKNIRLGIHVNADQVEAFNLGEHDNPYFYGNMRSSGTIDITGPTNAVFLGIDVRSAGEGNVHIPLDNKNGTSRNELLTFVKDKEKAKMDPYEAMLGRLNRKKRKGNDFAMKIKVEADPATNAFLEIDRTAGNVLSGTGAGIIDMDIRPNRNFFSINGEYSINQGNFRFNAMNIAERNFSISRGSSIHFNGDVMESDLNISGLYSTKASVAALIADTSSVSSRRMVDCSIGVTGKLKEPQVSLGIDVPDLDPTTKSKVESALNTDDKVQKQFIALLVSGSFMPDEQSGIVNNTNLIYTNMAEIMADQLNSILQKLEIPLDLGLSYKQSESGVNIFDVAVSTHLFNNRVLVNGAVGNKEFGNSPSGNNMAGDLDIDVKLDKSGQFRFNLFSHSADDYTNYLDNLQRSGIGITYQREFNTFKGFFQRLFASSRKKQENEQEKDPEAKEPIIIRITQDKAAKTQDKAAATQDKPAETQEK